MAEPCTARRRTSRAERPDKRPDARISGSVTQRSGLYSGIRQIRIRVWFSGAKSASSGPSGRCSYPTTPAGRQWLGLIPDLTDMC